MLDYINFILLIILIVLLFLRNRNSLDIEAQLARRNMEYSQSNYELHKENERR